MSADATLVPPQCLADALDQLCAAPLPHALHHLAQQEPVLGGFIQEKLAALAGQLALSGASTPVVRGVYREALLVVLGSLQALRLGHYQLWRDCVPVERLPVPDVPPLQRKPRRRRRSNEGDSEVPF